MIYIYTVIFSTADHAIDQIQLLYNVLRC